MTAYKKKLIEVALPLEAINRESAREKSIRHGHPSTLHLWWARRPLAACRAVLFASLVDDPSEYVPALLDDPTKRHSAESELAKRLEAWTLRTKAVEAGTSQHQQWDPKPTLGECIADLERQRLFSIIEEMVKWENSTNEAVLAGARAEIMRSTNGSPPPVLDPFCGGGSIPLEAQRLGLEAHANDLNPLAVLITKAMIEIPPTFAGLRPVNPEAQGKLSKADWHGAQGLADDVRYYGQWMRDEAVRRIGHLYPKVSLPKEHGGGEATVIAWLWARTVRCANPACGASVPLMKSLVLCGKPKRRLWLDPEVDTDRSGVRFGVADAAPPDKSPTITATGMRCPVCGSTAPFSYIRDQASSGKMDAQHVATIVDGGGRRIYLDAEASQLPAVQSDSTMVIPQTVLPKQALGFRIQKYGLLRHADLFTARQLILLAELLAMIPSAREAVAARARATMGGGPSESLSEGGSGPEAYADAVATYLVLSIGRLANRNSSLCFWDPVGEKVQQVFARNALPMTWACVEANPFSGSSGNYLGQLGYLVEALEALPASGRGFVSQLDATTDSTLRDVCVSTDPPYYDNVAYADLSDFFYVWLRIAGRQLFPDLFSTLLVPKQRELIAEPARHASRDDAKRFFEEGLGKAFEQMKTAQSSAYPSTVFYAFKQSEATERLGQAGAVSTGWETMLEGLLSSGLQITATWPIRTEQAYGLRDIGRNSLASSIVLACRPRGENAPLATRKELMGALRSDLPEALKNLQHGNIAPVDLAQASIGPGMAVFSRYSKVLEADGSRMTVRAALALINQVLDEILAEQEGEFDADTRWAIAWFQEVGTEVGAFGRADVLARAKNTSVEGMVEAGIVEARAGKVRLLLRDELDVAWDPATDKRLTVWEMTQHLIRRLDDSEAVAAALARQLGSFAEVARDLAYRLYLVCEREKWSQEGVAYNGLVVAWPSIMQLAASEPAPAAGSQTRMNL